MPLLKDNMPDIGHLLYYPDPNKSIIYVMAFFLLVTNFENDA